MDSTGTVRFAPDAEANYQLGLKSVDDRRYLDAMQFFEHIRYRHPYSSVAALADLAIADTYFVQDKFTEAIEGYRNFVKLRPNHPKVDYAEFRIALSYYKDIPIDFFLFPPSYEKDQSAVRGAAAHFELFLRKYPESEFVPEAREKLTEVRERLVDHEMSIAAFYRHHDRYTSAAVRFERVIHDFPASKRVGEALLGLADARLHLQEPMKAREALEKLIRDYPEDVHRAEAEARLAKIPESPAATESKESGSVSTE
jgi:outer membrane protein assembly factor BamD